MLDNVLSAHCLSNKATEKRALRMKPRIKSVTAVWHDKDQILLKGPEQRPNTGVREVLVRMKYFRMGRKTVYATINQSINQLMI